MLPTFVIGLREGLEAALIVGIVAAFLKQRDRADLLRWVWVGVGSAAVLCLMGGITLRVLSQNLPQRQQEGLETVVGVVAIVMVTYMVVWMKRHSRGLKHQLEGAAASALASGSGWALVAMAFLAVLREGFETSVFLLAAYNESDDGTAATVGAVLGLVVAVGIGYGIYRGGVRINLSRFFRITGVLLVLVAAGLVVSALHTAHEAGWLNVGQQQTLDLTALVRPGSVQESLLTGMLGIQARPVLIELIGWLLYLIPVGFFVGWPAGRAPARATVATLAGCLAAVATVVAIGSVLPAPAVPRRAPSSGADVASVLAPAAPSSSFTATVTHGDVVRDIGGTARRVGVQTHAGISTVLYTASVTPGAQAQTFTAGTDLSYAQVAALNGGSLPFGVREKDGTVPVSYTTSASAQLWVQPTTGAVVDVRVTDTVTPLATFSVGVVKLAPRVFTDAWPAVTVAAAASAASDAEADVHHSHTAHVLAASCAVLAVGAALLALGFLFSSATVHRKAVRRKTVRRRAAGTATEDGDVTETNTTLLKS